MEASKTTLQPVILVIFGITGDLSQRYLLPALYHLFKDGLLPDESVILGITRRNVTAEDLLNTVELCVNEVDKVCDPAGLARVKQALRMHQMSQTEGSEYDELLQLLNGIEDEKGICLNRLYYLSIPPQIFEPIVRNLGQHGLNKSCQHGNAHTRLLVEKPFGYDLASGQALIEETGEWFDESQLFRVDHYVAKRTVRNVMALRLDNPRIKAIWNNRHIKSIDVTAYEKIGIEGRAAFYEGVGALRDFIQSHLLQLLTIMTMEIPAQQTSDAIHEAKLALLKSVEPIAPNRVDEQALRGQYAGYREEVGSPRSTTETYAALTLYIDTPDWQGVPMHVKTGKAMAQRSADIRVVFKDAELVFEIQPNEGVRLRLDGAAAGLSDELESLVMDYNNGKHAVHPDAYERVLVDAARGDHTLFTTSEEVLAAWRIVENVIRSWGKSADGLIEYQKGSRKVEKPS